MHSLVTYDHSLLLHASALSKDGKDQLSQSWSAEITVVAGSITRLNIKLQRFPLWSVIYLVCMFQRISVKSIFSKNGFNRLLFIMATYCFL